MTIEHGGTTYRLAFGINAVCHAEDVAQRPFPELLEAAEAGSVSAMRTFVWALLRQHHGDLTLEDVGELMTAIGLPTLTERITSGFAQMTGQQPTAPSTKRKRKVA